MDFYPRAITKSSPLGEHRPRCSTTPTTNKIAERKTYCPWRFITQLIVVFTMITTENMTIIPFTGDL